jgi:hypothetical protein
MEKGKVIKQAVLPFVFLMVFSIGGLYGQSAANPEGVYTFYPRPRAARAGAPESLYIVKLEQGQDYTSIFLSTKAQLGGSGSFNGWEKTGVVLEDLDRSGTVYKPERTAWNDDRLWVLSFKRINISRFKLSDSSQNPAVVFGSVTLPAPDSAAAALPLALGTYNFSPGLQASQAGSKINLYLIRVEHSGDYTVFYLSTNAQGDRSGSFNGWDKGEVLLQDLARPFSVYYPVIAKWTDDRLWMLSFENVQGRRFKLIDAAQNPQPGFAEIKLDNPN